MRDDYGYGVNITTENRTFYECSSEYSAKSLENKSAEEIKSIQELNWITLQSKFPKEIEASKVIKMMYFLRTISTDLEETSTFVSINFL